MSALILLMIKIQITVTPIKLISSRVYIKQTYKMSSDRCRDPRNGTVIWKKITNIDSFWCNSLLKNASFKKKQMDSGCRRLQHKQLYSSHMLLLLQKGGQRCCTSQSWKKKPSSKLWQQKKTYNSLMYCSMHSGFTEWTEHRTKSPETNQARTYDAYNQSVV